MLRNNPQRLASQCALYLRVGIVLKGPITRIQYWRPVSEFHLLLSYLKNEVMSVLWLGFDVDASDESTSLLRLYGSYERYKRPLSWHMIALEKRSLPVVCVCVYQRKDYRVSTVPL